MKLDILVAILSLPLAGGITATWLWAKRRERENISLRLQKFVHRSEEVAPPIILKASELNDNSTGFFNWENIEGLDWLRSMAVEAGVEDSLNQILAIVILLLFAPPLIAYIINFDVLIATVGGVVLSSLPLIFVKMKGGALRAKFCEQLPDAIDLMVAVLRSGHSVSQAVRAVSLEVPQPCGKEFEHILQRMNLGQPLSESLILSARRFQSYELDLLRRAVAIQSEVGGSLAELLDKTNGTLRDRLKLVRQLRTVTAQSRLSANIVGLLPIVLAIGLNIISPGYLQLLTGDQMGQMLLVAVIVLEVIGIFVMRSMSTLKV